MEQVILVDKNDKELGTMEKIAAHQQGILHRAFSIFVFRPYKNSYECLLQERSVNKHHSKGVWSNTCCSHPRPSESIIDAGKRKLKQEMGIEAKDLKEIGWFIYRDEVGNNMIEHELDHVLIGYDSGQKVVFNPDEVDGYLWLDLDTIKKDLKDKKVQYSVWFERAFNIAISGLK